MSIRKRFGQHFLVDENVIDRIHGALAIQLHDRVLEVGPGRGALTEGLLESANQVVAVEIDRDLVSYLKDRYEALEVIEGDVLEVEIDQFSDMRVVGNLPYNISSPLLTRLLSDTRAIRDMNFMMQREVAKRLTSAPGSKSWGRLSVAAQYHCDVTYLFDVGAEAFQPQPAVQSAFVRLEPRPRAVTPIDMGRFDAVVRQAFGQRRKRIGNALKELEVPWHKAGIDPSLRAEQIDIDGFVRIANSCVDNAAESGGRRP
ncbi:MAG: 16S rRNA (adenine(1518)-N(6)/adenine(1519)-N(6))-dimethyltransferase RsmA [Pseudomonadales bacterium]